MLYSSRTRTSGTAKKPTTNPKKKKRRRPGKNGLPTTAATVTLKKQTQQQQQQQQQPPPNQKPRSIGEAVQQAETPQELLDVAAQLWLPTDPDLPPHLKTQAIHHEKRQRWSAQLLGKLGDACIHYTGINSDHSSPNMKLWTDDRLARAVLAAAMPWEPTKQKEEDGSNSKIHVKSDDKERRSVREALLGLHTFVGHTTTTRSGNQEKMTEEPSAVHEDIVRGVRLLMERAENMADEFSLQDAIEVRWAVRGIQVRLNSLLQQQQQQQILGASDNDVLSCDFERLDRRVESLPFDIIPMGLDYSSLSNLGVFDINHDTTKTSNENEDPVMHSLRKSIPFNFDTITTRQGTDVIERRATAWVAEEGIGALAYSGKLMRPSPMPAIVRTIMRQVETAIDAPFDDFFDCALCNYYPDGETSCRFHTDPEHGSMWERLNTVVSVGSPRRFAFRPIPEVTKWNEWDTITTTSSDNKQDIQKDDSANAAVVIRFFPGDIVSMFGTCNDDFHHAVYPENPMTMQPQNQHVADASRVSLVLKRAMVNGNRRGHGNKGEGRRSRPQNSIRP